MGGGDGKIKFMLLKTYLIHNQALKFNLVDSNMLIAMCHMFYLWPIHSYKYKRFVKQIFYIKNVNLYYNILLFNSEQIMHKYFIFKSSFILMFSDQYSEHHALFVFL